MLFFQLNEQLLTPIGDTNIPAASEGLELPKVTCSIVCKIKLNPCVTSFREILFDVSYAFVDLGFQQSEHIDNLQDMIPPANTTK